MEQSSIRVVAISNLIQLLLVVSIIVLVAFGALAVGWIWAGFPESIKPITQALKSSSLFIPLVGALSVIPASVLSGYLAGRMAPRRPILHGALSTCAWILLLILIALLGPPIGDAPHDGDPPASVQAVVSAGSFLTALLRTMISIGTPLLGALGGLAAHHREPSARRLKPHKETMIGEIVGYLLASRK
jgi:hypothetical protein